MQTKVSFDEHGEPKGVDVLDRGDKLAHLTISDGRAELSSISQRQGEDVVYGDDISLIMEQVGKLRFIDSVELPEPPEDPT